MKFGILQNMQWPDWTEQKDIVTNAVNQAITAEQLGFECAFWTEHHWTRHGILSAPIVVMTHVAAKTSTLRLGTAVLVLPFHDPARMAEEAGMADILSNGRLEFGVGRGFQWAEFHGFDVPLEESRPRFDEALDILLKGWRGDSPFTHQGKYWHYSDISIEPKPLQKPHPPIWLAASSVEGAARAGSLGLNLQMNGGVSLARLPQLISAYKEALEARGETFSPDRVMESRLAYIAETRQKAWDICGPAFNWFRINAQRMNRPPDSTEPLPDPFLLDIDSPVGAAPNDPGFLFCSPDEATSYIKEMEACGVGRTVFQSNFGGMANEDVMKSMHLIHREIMPEFKSEQVSVAAS